MSKKFIADRTLGKLAKWLRILGYDCVYWRSDDLAGLLRCAHDDERAMITKDGKLYRRRGGLQALLVRENDPFRQLVEVLRYFCLSIRDDMLFSRCLVCNEPLHSVSTSDVEGHVPDYVFHTHTKFSRCPSCGRFYWLGTHHDHMAAVVEKLKASLA